MDLSKVYVSDTETAAEETASETKDAPVVADTPAEPADAAPEVPATPESAPMPEIPVISPAPHFRTSNTTRSVMMDVILALLPAFAFGVYRFGYRALLLGVVSIASAILFEALIQLILRRPVTVGDLSAAVTGLLLAMNLPSTVPIWIPIVGSFFAVVVVKQLFGGIGKNIVNPALAARVFLFAWPDEMGTFAADKIHTMATADVVSTATPLSFLKDGALPTDVGILDLFFGNHAGCIGEGCTALLILGGLYLLIRRVISWHIPVSFLGTVALLCLLFPKVADAPVAFMLAELLSGGLMLGAIFMATDYATSPVTPWGRILFGVGCGLITVFIRFFGGYPEGVSFAILIMNLLVWYIDRYTMPVRFGGKAHEKKK